MSSKSLIIFKNQEGLRVKTMFYHSQTYARAQDQLIREGSIADTHDGSGVRHTERYRAMLDSIHRRNVLIQLHDLERSGGDSGDIQLTPYVQRVSMRYDRELEKMQTESH